MDGGTGVEQALIEALAARYGPEPIDDRSALDRAYAERRVTVINLIFSKPIDKLRSFADAFRIKKE